jgi:ATP-dependent RNA helicase RhlE
MKHRKPARFSPYRSNKHAETAEGHAAPSRNGRPSRQADRAGQHPASRRAATYDDNGFRTFSNGKPAKPAASRSKAIDAGAVSRASGASPAKPAKPAKAAKAGKPAHSAPSSRAAKPAKPAGPGKPGVTAKAVRPAQRPEPVVVDPWAGWLTQIEPAASFADLGLSDATLRTLEAEGYTRPTPIQSMTIPAALEGRDILGCAQTGTGKTAAFALPLIERLLEQGGERRNGRLASVLVLAPTRELAEQIAQCFGAYARGTGLRGTTVYGGVSQRKQEAALKRGVDVIVATPGRLIDLLEQNVVDLSGIRALAIDEADRMLDMGFIQPIRRIAAELTTDRQTLLFSATMPPKVVGLAEALLRDPLRVAVPRTAEREPKIEQSLFRLSRPNDKQALLEALLVQHEVRCGVVFTKTKHGAERVGKRLRAAGIRAEAIHGNKSQAQRQRALDSLRSGHSHVLVATDVAARGLDVDGVTHVFNYDLPLEPEAYIHRIGRTGRAGATGLAIAFCTPEERGLLRAIESLMGKPIPVNHELPELATARSASTIGDSSDDADDIDDDLDLEVEDAPRQAKPSRTPRTAHHVAPADRVMRPTPHWQPRSGGGQGGDRNGNGGGGPRRQKQRDRSNASVPRTKPARHR